MDSLVSIFDLGASVQPAFFMLGNTFNANLLKYASLMCNKGRFLDFMPAKSAFKEVDASGASTSDSSRISVFSMPGMQNPSIRLVDEVHAFWKDSFTFSVDSHLGTLWLDYLLTTSVCYVEVSRAGKVDKFFGTRSLGLVEKLVSASSWERNKAKWGTYLLPAQSDYVNDRLRILRISSLQTEPKVSVPKSAFNCVDIVSITPVCIISEYSRIFMEILKKNILRFTFKKDNGQVRTIDSTCNRDILSRVYGDSWADRVTSASGMVLNRGYIRIPELGISVFDSSGLRAVDVGRIQSVAVVQESDVDLSYVNVDFTCIVPTFRAVVSSINSVPLLQMLYLRVLGNPAPVNLSTPLALRTAILDYVSVQCLLSTSVYQRYLHTLMRSLPQLFLNYDGSGLPGVVDNLAGVSSTAVGAQPGGDTQSGDEMGAAEFLALSSDGYSADLSCLGFDLR